MNAVLNINKMSCVHVQVKKIGYLVYYSKRGDVYRPIQLEYQITNLFPMLVYFNFPVISHPAIETLLHPESTWIQLLFYLAAELST